MNEQDIEKLAEWGEPVEKQTKYGPKLYREANPTPEFSAAYKQHKDEIKALGANWSKDYRTGSWILVWWQPLPDELKAQRAQSFEESKASSADLDIPRPAGLEYMPFQRAGIRYGLARKSVLIADEMGLGKTIQAIGIVNADPSINSVLVVCPKSLKLNWKREYQKWDVHNFSVGVVDGEWPKADVVIINYEMLGKYEEAVQSVTWGCCIVDEAHLIKNAKALRSKRVKAIKAVRKIRLTGTPIVNRPVELYNLIEDLCDGWGSFFSFARRYANAYNNGWGWDFNGAANLDELQRRLRERIMVRRLKADVLTELPRKIRQVIEVEVESASERMAVLAERSYEESSDERLSDLRAQVELAKAEGNEAYKQAVERLREAMSVDFAEMSKLRHETAVSKIPAVIAHIQSVLEDNDNKVIIAAHHHDVVDALMSGLKHYGVVKVTGGDSEQERLAAVDAFQTDPDIRVFVGSIMAAGVGLTLTASSHVVFAELDWVPGNITQFEDRAHRIGQTQTVLVQHIVLDGSLDARMAHVLVKKQEVMDSALDKDHPERQLPVYVPKKSASTASETVDTLAKIGEKLTAEQVAAIHTALRQLAGLDFDMASEWNDMGFNKIDTYIGHSLAEAQSLTPKQAALGQKIVKKYHRQLGDRLMEEINGKKDIDAARKTEEVAR